MFSQQRFQRDRIIAPHTEHDPNLEHPDLDEKTMIKLHKEQRRRSEKMNLDRRNRDQDFRDPEQDMHRTPEKRKSSRKVDGFGGDHFSGPYDDTDALKSELIVILLTSSALYVMCCCLPFSGANNRVYLVN